MAVDLVAIDQMVEQAFRANRRRFGESCEIPILGGCYVQGHDRTEPFKEMVRRALFAREWFAQNGPPDLQPLPLGYEERERLKHGGADHIVAWYARSLDGLKYDVLTHPPFEVYARGVMASEFTLTSIKNDPELKRRFAPTPLSGLGPGLQWLTPKRYSEAMAAVKRSRWCARMSAHLR